MSGNGTSRDSDSGAGRQDHFYEIPPLFEVLADHDWSAVPNHGYGRGHDDAEAEVELPVFGSEWSEENSQGEDEAADDRR